jgi:hypothetical protein
MRNVHPRAQRQVLLAIETLAESSASMRLAISDIAEAAGYSDRHTGPVLISLVNNGCLTRWGGGRGRSRAYLYAINEQAAIEAGLL